ncbi:hypothetical protein Sm713_16510 [Streptomyces sp. TS71-3]|nr:hypothetical protein Sm713_16510 [Streptomyces sp. TS71-3]
MEPEPGGPTGPATFPPGVPIGTGLTLDAGTGPRTGVALQVGVTAGVGAGPKPEGSAGTTGAAGPGPITEISMLGDPGIVAETGTTITEIGTPPVAASITEIGKEPDRRNGTLLDEQPHRPHEVGGLEGLGDIGVDAGPGPEPGFLRGTAADYDDGQGTGPRIGPQHLRGAHSVKPRHDHIKGDHVRPHLMHDIQTLGTVSRGHDLETLQFEVDPDQLPDDLVVIDNKHPPRRPRHKSRLGRPPGPRPAFPHFHPLRGTSEGHTAPHLPRPPPLPHQRTPDQRTSSAPSQNPFMTTPPKLIGFYPSERNAPDTPP